MFGSIDGFYEFDPRDVRPDTYAPRVVLTYLVPIGIPRPARCRSRHAGRLHLSAGTHAFSVEFAALDRTVPRRNQYAYRMQGLRDEWVPLGGRREVTFTNLAAGRYVLGVRASNNDGVWSPQSEASLEIVIAPPFWRTWWFRGLVALVALGALALAYNSGRGDDCRPRRNTRAGARGAPFRVAVPQHLRPGHAGVFQSTVDGRLLAANPALARMFGYTSPEELLGEVRDIETQIFMHPSRRQEMRRLLEAFGAVHDFQYEARRRVAARTGSPPTSAPSRMTPATSCTWERRKTSRTGSRPKRRRVRCARSSRTPGRNGSGPSTRSRPTSSSWTRAAPSCGSTARCSTAPGGQLPGVRWVRNVEELGGGEPWHTAHDSARAVAYTGAASHAQVQDPGSGHAWELRATPIRAVDTDSPRTIVVARDVNMRS